MTIHRCSFEFRHSLSNASTIRRTVGNGSALGMACLKSFPRSLCLPWYVHDTAWSYKKSIHTTVVSSISYLVECYISCTSLNYILVYSIRLNTTALASATHLVKSHTLAKSYNLIWFLQCSLLVITEDVLKIFRDK